MSLHLAKTLKKLPSLPGVYLFYGSGRRPIYIGKAKNLRARACSYFQKRIRPRGTKFGLKDEIRKISYEVLDSEIAALIREAELIKRFKPKYNVLMRDDKNYSYVGFTGERFPRIFLTHQPFRNQKSPPKADPPPVRGLRTPQGLERLAEKIYAKGGSASRSGSEDPSGSRTTGGKNQKAFYVGPFTSGRALKTALAALRRIFPYCVCKRPHRGRCLSANLGLCFGWCCSLPPHQKTGSTNSLRNEKRTSGYHDSGTALTKSWCRGVPTKTLKNIELMDKERRYRQNINRIRKILSGQSKYVIKELEHSMQILSGSEAFEEAARLRDAIQSLQIIFSHRGVVKEHPAMELDANSVKLARVLGAARAIERIEGYDISDITGKSATGSMVVFVGAKPFKQGYRKFRIKTVRKANDTAMLAEIIARRLEHGEWPPADLILLDGGRAQLSQVAKKIKKKYKSVLPPFVIAALAKRSRALYLEHRKESMPLAALPQETALLLERIRDEAHRFARAYHHWLRDKELIGNQPVI